MKFEMVEYQDSHINAVKEFNRRFQEGGSHYRFPESPLPRYSKAESTMVYQQYFLAVSGNDVHGGYILKHQGFIIKGEEKQIASFELPISEGIINRKYNSVAPLLLLDCLKREPLVFCVGLGGFDQPVTKFLQRSGWSVSPIPFYFRIINPASFLRNIKYLKKNRLKSVMLDFLAYSGLGWLGLKLHQTFISRKKKPHGTYESYVVSDFGDWADELWNSLKGSMYFALIKDCHVLRILYRPEDPDIVRLRILAGDSTVGWAVLKVTELSNHNFFGNMKMGTIVDCFSAQGYEDTIIFTATKYLEKHNVDLIVSNQSHSSWTKALSNQGYMQGPTNFLLACSKELTAMLDPVDKNIHRMDINRGNSGYWNF
jgi:hypothetical protein